MHGLPWNKVDESTARFIGFKLGKLLGINKNEYRDSLMNFLENQSGAGYSKPPGWWFSYLA